MNKIKGLGTILLLINSLLLMMVVIHWFNLLPHHLSLFVFFGLEYALYRELDKSELSVVYLSNSKSPEYKSVVRLFTNITYIYLIVGVVLLVNFFFISFEIFKWEII